jgi:Zn-dependent protease
LRCQYCGVEEFLPFKCPFCGGYFCVEHRLPENHECPELWKAWLPRRDVEPTVTGEDLRRHYDITRRIVQPESRVLWFSYREVGHLLAGTLLVMAVGLSVLITPYGLFLNRGGIGLLFASVLVFSSIFILHEIAHKAAAQYYGLWAEFRLSMLGAMITLLSIFSPIKLISPGAVMVAGEADRRTLGRTALAGPLMNIVLSFLFLAWAFSAHSRPARIGAIYSPWIALFNLIPFGILDGAKVLWWSKKVWAVSFFLSLTLTAVAMVLL